MKYQALTFGQQGVEGAEPQRVMWKMEQEPTSLLDGFQAQKNPRESKCEVIHTYTLQKVVSQESSSK